jgi:hypothetical protein
MWNPLKRQLMPGSVYTVHESLLKMHLTLNGCVENRFKMLEYQSVCSAFESVFALPLSVIYYF